MRTDLADQDRIDAVNGSGELLRGLPWSLRRSFRAAATQVSLAQREVLFHVGDAGEGCYYLRRGVVTASVIARDGQERLLAVIGPGSLIGEMALADDAPRSATVKALKPCRLLHIRKAAFFRLADANPVLYRGALKILAGRLRVTNESVLAQGAVTVAGRVARALLSLAEGLGETEADGSIVLRHRISQSDVAGLAGAARENTSRAINSLLRNGVLQRRQGLYVIAKPAILQQQAMV